MCGEGSLRFIKKDGANKEKEKKKKKQKKEGEVILVEPLVLQGGTQVCMVQAGRNKRRRLMSEDGGLLDQNGNKIDTAEIKCQGQELKVLEVENWKLKFLTIDSYLEWAKKQRSLTEEMIENI